MSEAESTIKEFIRENFVAGRTDTTISRDISLIESGIMDSTGVLELVEYIESTFGITIEDEELIPENLESIGNILAFLETKGAG